MGNNYVMTINLHTENSTPPYQITQKLEKEGFHLPPHKMPVTFEWGDTIEFRFIGREIIDCTLYVKPLTSGSLNMPFKPFVIPPIKLKEEFKSSQWHIPLWKNKNLGANGVEITQLQGIWDFTIAGVFNVPIVKGIDQMEGVNKMDDHAYMPFLVDPECVVGREI